MSKMVEICGLDGMIGKDIGELSKGYRQRVGIAQALIHEPEILILDEPTVGLDPNQVVEIRNLIKDVGREKTVVLSTHILREVEATCNRVIIISSGEIVADGTTENLISELAGQAVIHLELKGNISDAPDEFSSIDEVENVNLVLDSDNGTTKLDITLSGSQDITEEIFKKTVEKGWVILEMNQHKTNLEDVFRQLTLSREGGVQ